MAKMRLIAFLKAIRSVALPTILQKSTVTEAYIRSLRWDSYLRIEAMVHAYRSQVPDVGDVAILFAVWKEFRRILFEHRQNVQDNAILRSRMGTDR